MTKADKIRQMDDEELATILTCGTNYWGLDVPDCSDGCEDFCGGCAKICPTEKQTRAVLEWLQEEY